MSVDVPAPASDSGGDDSASDSGGPEARPCPQLGGQETVGVTACGDGVMEGYTLFTPHEGLATWLVDLHGRVVHEWPSGAPLAAASAYLQDDGSIYRTCSPEDDAGPWLGYAGCIERVGWDGEVSWRHRLCSDELCGHHDLAVLPDGNLLVLVVESWPRSSWPELGLASEGLELDGVWLEAVYELRPLGTDEAEVVWRWHVSDHLVQDELPNRPNYGVPSEHPGRLDLGPLRQEHSDWVHLNGISYDSRQDQVLLSAHHGSEIWIVDHSTTTAEAEGELGGSSGRGGQLLYRWGNPEAWDAGDADDRRLFGQHHAHWIPEGHDGEGDVRLFNNGRDAVGDESRDFSSVDQIELPRDGAGGYTFADGYGPDRPSWSLTDIGGERFYSSIVSGAQRLANGNTLVCIGARGRVAEVGPAGEVVWNYVNPALGGGDFAQQGDRVETLLYRAERIASDHPGLAGRDLTPGEPLEGR